MIDDEYIIKKFFNESGRLNGNFSTEKYLSNYPEILDYLKNRFDDSECLRETFLRILLKIEHRPKCPICGEPVKYRGKKSKLYSDSCGKGKCYCKIRDNIMLEKYGITNFGGTPETIEKIKKTKLLKYGDENYSNKEKREKTCLERYGKKYPISDEIIKKREKTCLERYGYTIPAKSKIILDKIKNTCLERYGVDNYRKSKECIEKIYNTKKRNKTFTTSKIEENCYIWLCEEYGKNNIVRQYKDSRYINPKNNHLYNCDFYIIDKDLFIEIQGHFSHGPHPYNPNLKDDIELLNIWKSKESSIYRNAIICWTKKDVTKRTVAKENNLKYIEIFDRNINKDKLIKTINNYGKIS